MFLVAKPLKVYCRIIELITWKKKKVEKNQIVPTYPGTNQCVCLSLFPAPMI